jgi:hypothetical protein
MMLTNAPARHGFNYTAGALRRTVLHSPQSRSAFAGGAHEAAGGPCAGRRRFMAALGRRAAAGDASSSRIFAQWLATSDLDTSKNLS